MVHGFRIVMFVLAAILGGWHFVSAPPWSRTGLQGPIPSEKTSRTPAQQKISSQLLYEIYRARGQAAEKNVPPGETGVTIDRKKRALIDVRADVTTDLQKKMRSLKGTIVSTSPQYRTIVAWMPLLKLERLAEDRRVSAISPQAEPVMHR